MNAFLWAVLAALCWGVAPLLEKAGLWSTNDPVLGVLVRSIGVIAGLVVFPFLIPQLGERLSEMPLRSWVLLGGGGILASIAGQICFYQALKVGEVSRVVPIAAAYPIIAFLLAIVLLGESFTALKGVGVALVVLGTYLLR